MYHSLESLALLLYVKTIISHLKNLKDRSISMIFIGYEMGSKAYRCFDPKTFKVQVSRNAIFEENISWKWNEMKESPNKLGFSSPLELLIDFGDVEGTFEVSTREGIDNTSTDLVDQSQLSQIFDDQRTARPRHVLKIYDETYHVLSNEVDCTVLLEEPNSF